MAEEEERTPPIPFRNKNETLFIHFINIGEGDCILLEIPDTGGYKTFLVDLGRGGLSKLNEFREKLKIRAIDYAIITHPNIDHSTDLGQLLEDNPNLHIWVPKNLPKTSPKKYITAIERYLNRIDVAEIGKLPLTLKSKPKGFRNDLVTNIEILGPSHSFFESIMKKVGGQPKGKFIIGNLNQHQTNNLSLIIKVDFSSISILIPGDVETEGWQNFFEQKYKKKALTFTDIKILKISHHGDEKGTPEMLLNAIFPQYAISTLFKTTPQDKTIDLIMRSGVEECYGIGFTLKKTKYSDRISCTFAIKPNLQGNNAIIIPMIYSVDKKTNEDVFFIRPQNEPPQASSVDYRSQLESH